MTNNDNFNRVRDQLLNMMTATKAVIDARNSNNGSIGAAIAKLQDEYIRSVVLMKNTSINVKIPALLRTSGPCALEQQIIQFRETLSVGLGES